MLIDAGGLRMVVTDSLPGEGMAPHRHSGAQVEFLPGSGQVAPFFFRDPQTPADSAHINCTVFRRRPGS